MVGKAKSFKQFAILWSGQFLALLGSGLASFGFSVWIFEKTGSSTPFALTFLVTILPGILFGPFSGSFADRQKRKLVIIMANVLDIVMKVLLAVLFYFEALDLWMIYLLLFLSSTFQTFQGPALTASIPALVPTESLNRANGLMQFSASTRVMLAPAMAGFLYPILGLTGLLAANFLTFTLAIIIFSLLHIPQPTVEKSKDSILRTTYSDFKVSLGYLLKKDGLMGLLLMLALVNFVSVATTVLLGPMVLSLYDTKIYGSVQFVCGLATIAGGLLAGLLPNVKNKVKTMFLVFLISGVGITVAGISPNWLVIAFGFFLYNLPMPYASSLFQSVIQVKVEPEVLGRVTALVSMILRLVMPLASLVAGPLADFVFEPLMANGGPLSNSFIGKMIGLGVGRGTGLFYILSGIFLLTLFALALRNQYVISIEERLPSYRKQQEPGLTTP